MKLMNGEGSAISSPYFRESVVPRLLLDMLMPLRRHVVLLVEHKGGRTAAFMDVRMDGWTDGWTDGRMDGWRGGRVDGWMDR